MLERLPVILPDLKPWEINFMELKQKRDVHRKKQYPTKQLRMNVVKDILLEQEGKKLDAGEEPLPHKVEPWVYRNLSRGTNQIGPFMNIKNLDSRLQRVEELYADTIC